MSPGTIENFEVGCIKQELNKLGVESDEIKIIIGGFINGALNLEEEMKIGYCSRVQQDSR